MNETTRTVAAAQQMPVIRRPFTLRPFMTADIAALTDLWVESWQATMPEIDFVARRGWLGERLAAHHAAGVDIVCAADEPGYLLGFITVDAGGRHIDQLAVRASCFGTGVAAALLAEARRLSPAALHLEVNQQNSRAVSFYRREGFAVVAAGSIGSPGRPIWHMQWQPQASAVMG